MELLLSSSMILWCIVLIDFMITIRLLQRSFRVKPMSNIPSSPPFETLNVGDAVPDFSAETLARQKVSLSDYSEAHFVMIFISPYCTPCRKYMPEIEATYTRGKRTGMDLVVVSIGEMESTKRFVEDLQVSVPLIVAPRGDNPLSADYKVNGTPMYYLIINQRIQASGLFGPNWEQDLSRSWRAGDTRI